MFVHWYIHILLVVLVKNLDQKIILLYKNCQKHLKHETKDTITVQTLIDRGSIVLFLILTFGGITIRNSQATPLAAATRTIRELVLFKSSYISSLYGI